VSGRLVGEVIDAAERLYAAGLSRSAVLALAPIAEGCREESRMGTAPHARIAAWLGRSERTAERAVQELLAAGVVVLVQRGGGREKAKNRYYLPPLERWERAGTPDIQMAGVQARQPPLVAAVRDENSRHSDGGSSAPDTSRTPDTQMSGVRRTAGGNSRQNGAELPPSLDVGSPVVPVRTLGGTPSATTDRATVPDTASPPEATSTTSTAPTAAVPAGSRCGLPSCLTPRPCGPCADARRAEADRTVVERVVAAMAARQQAVAARASAIAACPLGCDDRGYLGVRVCDHDPDRVERTRRGRALVDAQLRRPPSRADVERDRQDALAELDVFQPAPEEDPAHVPRVAEDSTSRPDQDTDQREHVA